MEESKKSNENGCGYEEHTFFGVEKSPVMYAVEFTCFCFGGIIGLMLFNNAWGIISGGLILIVIAHFIQYIYRKLKKINDTPVPK